MAGTKDVTDEHEMAVENPNRHLYAKSVPWRLQVHRGFRNGEEGHFQRNDGGSQRDEEPPRGQADLAQLQS